MNEDSPQCESLGVDQVLGRHLTVTVEDALDTEP